MATLDEARAKILEWRRNPVRFVRDSFHVEPDAWQADALAALGGDLKPRRRLCMKSCTGAGKSAVLAWVGWHRLACYADRGNHPKGAALSGEGRDNLRDNLWAELAKWQACSPFLSDAFVWTKEQIFARQHAATWFLSARSYAKDADAEAIGRSLSGLHSRYPFVLLDEIGDSPVALIQKATQIFTGEIEDALIAISGNPTSVDGLLHHVCQMARDLWAIITVTADPDDPKRTNRVDIEHAREQIRLYGRDNPWVMATILGLFPPASINALLGVDEVEAAMGRHLRPDDYETTQKRLGIDAARFGDDPWVIFPRQGLAAFKCVEMRNPRSHEVAARVALIKSRWGSEMEFFDGTGGYAAGAIDALIQAGHAPHEISFSGKADDTRYFNKRSEMWFRMAEWVKRGGALPQDPKLLRELTAATYVFHNSKFRLEEKDQIKKRIGSSPDRADALALTFAIADMPTSVMTSARERDRAGKALHEYDPLAQGDGAAEQEFGQGRRMLSDYDPIGGDGQ